MMSRFAVSVFFAFWCLNFLPLMGSGLGAVAGIGEARAHSGTVIAVERGDPLRGVLLDAARPTFVAETDGDVEFVVRRLTVWGPWAFGQVKPQRPGGSPIDWSRTSYADIHAQGDLDGDGESYFLLIRHSGEWVVHEFAIGPTDVVWAGWQVEYHLPAGMFGD